MTFSETAIHFVSFPKLQVTALGKGSTVHALGTPVSRRPAPPPPLTALGTPVSQRPAPPPPRTRVNEPAWLWGQVAESHLPSSVGKASKTAGTSAT